MKIKNDQEIKSASLERFPLSPIAPTNDLRFGFVTGYSQAQSDLLESASEGFEDWQREFIGTRPFYNGNTLWQQQAWQACSLHHAKAIKEKDERIKELEDELRWKRLTDKAWFTKCQEAIKDIEYLLNFPTLDAIAVRELKSKYGLDKQKSEDERG